MRQATSSRPTLDLESLGGYNPIDTGQPWFRDDATFGKRFGAHQRFGVMFSYSYDLNDIGTDDVEPVPDFNPNGDTAPTLTTTFAIQRVFLQSHPVRLWRKPGLQAVGEFRSLCARPVLKLQGLRPEVRPTILSVRNTDGHWTMPAASLTATAFAGRNYQISDLILGGNQVFSHSYIRYVAAISHSREGGAAGNPGADFDPLNRSTSVWKHVHLHSRPQHLPAAVPLRGKRSHLRPHPVRPERHQPHHRPVDAAQSAGKRVNRTQLPSWHARIDIRVWRAGPQRA